MTISPFLRKSMQKAEHLLKLLSDYTDHFNKSPMCSLKFSTENM